MDRDKAANVTATDKILHMNASSVIKLHGRCEVTLSACRRPLHGEPTHGLGGVIRALLANRRCSLSVRGQGKLKRTPCNRCVRFATTVASGHATLATKRTLLLTWAGLAPAGSHQLLRLAHLFNHVVGAGEQHAPHAYLNPLGTSRHAFADGAPPKTLCDEALVQPRRAGEFAEPSARRDHHAGRSLRPSLRMKV